MINLFFLSATSFYCGLHGVVDSLLIPESMHKSLNSYDFNSSPLSNQKVLIFFSMWFSIKALNYLNLLNTSSFLFKNIENSSMKETYYTCPLNKLDDIELHTLEWMISKIPFALLSLLGNVFFLSFLFHILCRPHHLLLGFLEYLRHLCLQ